MYLGFLVKIPAAPGKPLYEKRGEITYIKFEYDRIYDPVEYFNFGET